VVDVIAIAFRMAGKSRQWIRAGDAWVVGSAGAQDGVLRKKSAAPMGLVTRAGQNPQSELRARVSCRPAAAADTTGV